MNDSGTSDDAARSVLRPGDRFGDCTVRRLVGAGAMGVVYLVHAPDNAEYALKVMDAATMPHGSDKARRFMREVEFAMEVRHKNLVEVHAAGEDPETGVCYMLMDYMPGGSLADVLERHGPLSVAKAVSIASDVASALEAAHRHGVIHRDIKPANILFAADGTPKLADLGVAKFDGVSEAAAASGGMIVGTPAYMAPEQIMNPCGVDARADIYSLGVVTYEMLANRRPNGGSTVMGLLARAIRGEPFPDVRETRPETPDSVAHVLSMMCAPKPDGRPGTASAAAGLLVRAASGSLVLADAEPRPGLARRVFSALRIPGRRN